MNSLADTPQVPAAQQAVASEMLIGKRGRIRAYLFEIATAVAFPILGVAYLLNPAHVAAHSLISQRVYPFDLAWSILFVAGGAIVLFGVMKPSLQLRAFGLILLGTGCTMEVVAAVYTRPDLREMFNVIYGCACFARAYLIIKLALRYKAIARDA